MKILGWDANLTWYAFSGLLLGTSVGIFISNFWEVNLGVAWVLLALSFVLSLYFWHVKKVKNVFMKK